MNKNTKNGSALAYSLIILSLMLIVATGITLSAALDRGSSGSTSESMLAFEASDTGAELMIRNMRNASTIADLPGCNNATGMFIGNIDAKRQYAIALTDTMNVFMHCQTAAARPIADIARVKSYGKYGLSGGKFSSERATEVPIQPATNAWITAGGGCGFTQIYSSDLPSQRWSAVGIDCVGPQCNVGNDLVMNNTPDFSAYDARQACKNVGGALPTVAMMSCIAAQVASNANAYGNVFQSADYWTAHEEDLNNARAYNVLANTSGARNKATPNPIRCVK